MFNTIKWDEKYTTGVAIIDDQHQRIFRFLDEIDDAIKTKNGDAVEDVVIGLLDYAVSHNEFEEHLMEEAGFPHTEMHQTAHDAFRRRSEDYVRRIASGENRFRLARQIRNDIGLWLTGHIMQEDMKYVPYMRAHQPEEGMVSRLLSRFFHKASGASKAA